MKRIVLIAVALCCMIAVSAQEQNRKQLSLKEKVKRVETLNRQSHAVTQKLDSIVNDDNSKLVFEYDNHFRRTSMKTLLGNVVFVDQQFVYDNNGHLSYTTTVTPFYSDKYEYSYNAQGLVAEETEYDRHGDSWDPEYKTNYEYDSQGHLTVAIEKEYDEGNWINYKKMEYSYTAGKLTKVLEYSWGWDGDEWWESDSEVYSYDHAGNCISLLVTYRYPNTDWMNLTKYEYEYDSYGNCVKENNYEYSDSKEWVIEEVIEYTYDASIPSSSIASYDEIFGELVIKLKSKLLKVVDSSYDDGQLDETTTSILYYSKGSQVADLQTVTLTVSPNPASTFLAIQAEDLRQVEIFSMDGKMVMCLEKGFESVNISALATGTYLLKATMNNSNVITEKFMKQ